MSETGSRLRILVDTNILISAALNSSSQMRKLLVYIMDNDWLLLCNDSIEEGFEVINRKFPTKISSWKYLLSWLNFETVYSPEYIEAPYIRDEKDIPILYSAILANPDIFITGDKDFHTDEIKQFLNVYSPADFIRDFT